MPDLSNSKSGGGERTAHRLLKETAVQQFAGGVAVAIAAVGFARGGRDTWLGVALLISALVFALRAYHLAQEVRELDQIYQQANEDRVRDLINSAVASPPPHRFHLRRRK
jgi:hypothetical protein